MAGHKNKYIAISLWFFLGLLGGHRFYLRSPARGVLFIGLAVLGSQLDAAGRGEEQYVFYVMLALWLYDLYWIFSGSGPFADGQSTESSDEAHETIVDLLADADVDVEVEWDSSGDPNDGDGGLRHTHCIIFNLVEHSWVKSLLDVFEDHDHALGTNSESAVIYGMYEIPKGTDLWELKCDAVADALRADDRLTSEVQREFVTFVEENESMLQSMCRDRAEARAGDYDDGAPCESVGLLIMYFKSSKPFDAADLNSEGENINAQLTSRNGFISACRYEIQDVATCYSNFFDDSYSVIYLDDAGIKWNAESFSKDVVWEDQTGEKILQI